MLIVIQSFYYIIGHIICTLSVERIVKMHQSALNEALAFKTANQLRRGYSHLPGCSLYGNHTELHDITFMCAWTSFHIYITVFYF